jgi:hypothetical protein
MTDMKHHPFLAFLLGLWIGGSVFLGAVVYYNFAGFDDLFMRNPVLAQHAGFDPADTAAKKSSLLWVHSAELNRVIFEHWNRVQIVLAALALALAVRWRAHWLPTSLLALALGLALLSHFGLEPQIIELGRQLDFVPRDPPPPLLAPFQQAHRNYFIAELARLGAVLLAATLLLWGGPRPPRAA